MTLSVIITNYNYNQYLQEAIDSCEGADEVIVVDDCSDEAPVVTGWNKIFINKKNIGLSASRNRGISLATGDRIICLDADDKLDPAYIKACKEDTTKDVLYGNYTNFGDDDGVTITPEFNGDALYGGNYIPCVACYKREQVYPMGVYRYDEDMKEGYEDWDFLIQMMKGGETFRKIDVNMFYYRQHKGSMIHGTREKHNKLMNYIHNKYEEIPMVQSK